VLVAQQVCHPALLMFCAVALRQSPPGPTRKLNDKKEYIRAKNVVQW
jgi:hypothetical protein